MPVDFPNSEDSVSYIQWSPGQSGEGEVKQCPPGQMYSAKMRACADILPSITRRSSSYNLELEMLDERANTSISVYTEGDKLIWDQLEPGSYCTTDDFERTGCKGPWDCVYNYLFDCWSYVKCTPNEDGKGLTAHYMRCPEGEMLSLATRMCQPTGSPGTCNGKYKDEDSDYDYFDYSNHVENEKLCSFNAIMKAGCQLPTIARMRRTSLTRTRIISANNMSTARRIRMETAR
jgi:hypothetical protein